MNTKDLLTFGGDLERIKSNAENKKLNRVPIFLTLQSVKRMIQEPRCKRKLLVSIGILAGINHRNNFSTMRLPTLGASFLRAVLLAASVFWMPLHGQLTDDDGDGFFIPDDCDDTNPAVNPGAFEIPANGIDEDCDGMESCYLDYDGDGYGTYSLIQSLNMECDDELESNNYADCNDGDDSIHPGAIEFPDDGIDQDCNNIDAITCYSDGDGDGYGGGQAIVALDGTCDAAESESGNSEDCNDNDPTVNPGAAELNDCIDNDCDGIPDMELDFDNDGLSGLLEHAWGTDPCVADNAPLVVIDAATFIPGTPAFDLSDLSKAYVRFSRRINHVDERLTYNAQFSNDLTPGGWEIGGDKAIRVSYPGSGDYEVVEVPWPTQLSNGKTAFFMRVGITWK